MFNLILENLSSIIVSLILIVIVVAVVLKLIKNKKNGKSSCGCGCSNCAMKGKCHKWCYFIKLDKFLSDILN